MEFPGAISTEAAAPSSPGLPHPSGIKSKILLTRQKCQLSSKPVLLPFPNTSPAFSTHSSGMTSMVDSIWASSRLLIHNLHCFGGAGKRLFLPEREEKGVVWSRSKTQHLPQHIFKWKKATDLPFQVAGLVVRPELFYSPMDLLSSARCRARPEFPLEAAAATSLLAESQEQLPGWKSLILKCFHIARKHQWGQRCAQRTPQLLISSA